MNNQFRQQLEINQKIGARVPTFGWDSTVPIVIVNEGGRGKGVRYQYMNGT